MLNKELDLEFKIVKTADEYKSIHHFFVTTANEPGITEDIFFHEYNNPEKYSTLVYAVKNNQIVGTHAFLGFDLIKTSKVINTIMGERVLVDKSQRGSNLFPLLFNEGLRMTTELAHCHFMWGTNLIPKIFEKKFGFKAYKCLALFVLNLTTINYRPNNFLDRELSIEYQYSNKILENLLSLSCQHPEILFLKYSELKYQWLIGNDFSNRCLLRFHFENELKGFCVLRVISTKQVGIDDIYFFDENFADIIIFSMLQELKLSRFSDVSFIANRDNTLLQTVIKILQKFGFIEIDYDPVLIIKTIQSHVDHSNLYFTKIWGAPFY